MRIKTLVAHHRAPMPRAAQEFFRSSFVSSPYPPVLMIAAACLLCGVIALPVFGVFVKIWANSSD